MNSYTIGHFEGERQAREAFASAGAGITAMHYLRGLARRLLADRADSTNRRGFAGGYRCGFLCAARAIKKHYRDGALQSKCF